MNNIYISLIFDGNLAMMMAATRSATGVITPLAFESQRVNSLFDKNGVISVSDDTALVVSQLLKKMNNKIGSELEISGIYLGIMPRSMHGERIEARRDFEGKRRVTERDIEVLGREIAKKINNTVIAQYGNGFVRDGQETFNVRNEFADTIVRKDLAVVVSPRHIDEYADLLPQNIALRGLVPTQVAIARLVSDEEQRVSGVMSFHIGNQSSGLTYLYNDCVVGTAVVPFGFDHIIKDMTLGKISDEDLRVFLVSDKMKYKWTPNTTIKFSNDGPSFSLNNASEAFNARIREIFSLAYERILATLCLQELKVPVIVTTSLINTDDFVNALSGLLEQDCTLGNASAQLNDDTFSAPKYIPLLAVVNEATKSCVTDRTIEIQIEEQPQPSAVTDDKSDTGMDNKAKGKKKSILSKIKEQTLRFNEEQ